jgi:hypothetical protein
VPAPHTDVQKAIKTSPETRCVSRGIAVPHMRFLQRTSPCSQLPAP